MRLTQEADYALRIVWVLGRENETLDARKISEKACVPERFTVKILRKLVQNGIAASRKGAMGGYLLASDPRLVTMKQVIETIEGPLGISRCLGEDYDCARNPNKKCCIFHLIFEKINKEMVEKFDRITIADTVDDKIGIDAILEII